MRHPCSNYDSSRGHSMSCDCPKGHCEHLARKEYNERQEAHASKIKQLGDAVIEAARETLKEQAHLADGDNCTLKRLKDAVDAYEEALRSLSVSDSVSEREQKT